MLIKQARERTGLKQRGLATVLNVSPGLVGRWETPEGNSNSIGFELLVRLAAVLQVPITSLVNGGEPEGKPSFPLEDPKEIALVSLFRTFDKAQKASHLALFYTTAGRRQPPE